MQATKKLSTHIDIMQQSYKWHLREHNELIYRKCVIENILLPVTSLHNAIYAVHIELVLC